MPCLYPVQGYFVHLSSGKKKFIASRYFFDCFTAEVKPNPLLTHYHPERRETVPIPQSDYGAVPCGRCKGCRLDRSKQWAVRIMHEVSLHTKSVDCQIDGTWIRGLVENCCFITLTYDNEHLPADKSLNKRHFQLFMKKLRKKYGAGIRFYHCGEYGDEFHRPHYHAILFGHDFEDKRLWKVANGERLFVSDALSSLWGRGFSTVGNVTFKSAAYVARYCLKKINGDLAEDHYQGRLPEYSTMSRRPGIAANWFKQYGASEVYPSDQVVIAGKTYKPPRFYDSQFEIMYPEEYILIKEKRKARNLLVASDNTFSRLQAKAKCLYAGLKNLIRPLESNNDTKNLQCL